jgi:hypothetical protein
MCSTATEAASKHELHGVVFDENSSPAAQVPVWLLEIKRENNIKPAPVIMGKTATDDHGRFRFIIPRTWFETAYPWRPDLGLIVHRTGRRPVGLILDRGSLPPQTAVKLLLLSPGQAALQLVQPNGQPLAGCPVSVKELLVEHVRGPAPFEREAVPPTAVPAQPPDAVLSRAVAQGHVLSYDSIHLPSEISAALRAQSDTRGRVCLPDVPLSDLAGITVATRDFGTQEFAIIVYPGSQKKEDKAWPATLTLKPVGKVTGSLRGPPSTNPNVSLYLRSSEYDFQKGMSCTGVAHVHVDTKGRFEVPALAAGNVFTQLEIGADAKVALANSPRSAATLEAGRTANLAILLTPTVQVCGLARERGTGRPLTRVQLVTGSRILETDAQGRFSFRTQPGPVQWQAIYGAEIPALSLQEAFAFKREVPVNVEQFDMPPLDLPTRGTVKGTVMNEDGQSAADAIVLAIWLDYDYRTGSMRPYASQATTDKQGSFQLSRIALNRAVRLKAYHESGACTEKLLVLNGAGSTKPIKLSISRRFAHRAEGVILGEDDSPMRNTSVELWWRPGTLSLTESLPEPVAPTRGSGVIPQEAVALTLGPIPEIRLGANVAAATDSDGHFHAPQILDRDGEYQAVVRAEGCVPGATGWRTPVAGQPLRWPELHLNLRRYLEGQVEDRQGQPVGGANIVRSDGRSLLRTITDSSGHFKLDLIVTTPGFLFVDAEGFRFHGQPSQDTKSVRIALTRATEAVAGRMTTLGWGISKEDRRALAEKLRAPLLNDAWDKDKDDDRLTPLQILAGSNPARLMEVLEKKPLQSEWFDGYVRRAAAKPLLKENLEEARMIVDAIRAPNFRVAGYLDLCDSLLEGQTEQRRELLSQALLHARSVVEADHRVIYLGQVAERLLAIGEKGQAEKIFHEGLEGANNLSTAGWSGYARGAFAESLSLLDLSAALKLIEGLQDRYEFDRHHGNIARKIARSRPAEAERVLQQVRGQWQQDQYAVRVCYRMAIPDLGRAARVAGKIKNGLFRAEAYGVIAQALTKTDKKAATHWLRQAFAVLAEQPAQGHEDYTNFVGSSSLAAGLVPVAEAIDPQLVPECFWRAVSYRVPRIRERPSDYPRGWMADAALALAVARYDREVAGVLLHDAAPILLRNLQNGGNRLLEAMAVANPVQAGQWTDELGKKDSRRVEVASLLVLEGETLWRRVHRILGLWLPADPDLGSDD